MASDLNTVALIGRLTRDAELKYMPTGNAVANMSIAVNRSKKEGDQWISEADFFDVQIFGKQAESLGKYLLKGKQIAVQGSLRQNRWEKDGQKFSRIIVNAQSVELLGGSGGGGGNSGSSGAFQQRPAYQQAPQEQGFGSAQGESFGGDNSFPDDIPF